jgi:hypothetical protein
MHEPPPDNKDKPDQGGVLLPENSEEKTNPLLPNPDSIVAEVTFISPKGKEIKIIRTNERDEYERPPAKKAGKRRHPKD